MTASRPARATIDFETRSTCELKYCGSWKYSCDPTTEILCLAYRLPHWAPGRTGLWHPAYPSIGLAARQDDDLTELFAWVMAGKPIEAHNAAFERAVWANIMVRRYGFPAIRIEQWHCSAVRCAAHALPRALEDVIAALNIPTKKDMVGNKAMKKATKPRKPRKAEREWWARHGEGPHPTVWHEDRELFEQVFGYCRQDVLAEEAVSGKVPELLPSEQDLYTLDQRVNERGFQLDMAAVHAALVLIELETLMLNAELGCITNGAVTRATQRAKLTAWFEANGLCLENTQASTLDEQLEHYNAQQGFEDKLDTKVRRALTILRTLGRSSTAKFEAMVNWACEDGRVRGGLLFHGAGTGRWSGAGVQPHNFPRGTLPDFDMRAAWEVIKTGCLTDIEERYRSVMEVLSSALRGAITAQPGKRLYVADYAGIEARVLLWMAEDEDGLDIFRSGRDIYCEMATDIYGRPITKKDKDERQLGKAAILGCGFQMGPSKFVSTAANYGAIIDEVMSQATVDAYRTKFWRVKQMWWDTERAAITAVLNRGRRVSVGRVTYVVEGPFLYCELPSGRRLAYPFPSIRKKMTPWGEMKDSLTFMGVNPLTRQWQHQTTYGGSLVENYVQAVARDLMAASMVRAEESGIYTPVLTVHDELVAEAHPMLGDIHDFNQLVAAAPAWADGLPIAVEGFDALRYRK